MDLLREKLKARVAARLFEGGDGGGDGGGDSGDVGGESDYGGGDYGGGDYGGYGGGGYESGYGGPDYGGYSGGGYELGYEQAAPENTFAGDLSPLEQVSITGWGPVANVQAGSFAPDVGGRNWGGLIGRVAGTLTMGPVGGLLGYGIGTMAQQGYFGQLSPQEQSMVNQYDSMTGGEGTPQGFMEFLQQQQTGATNMIQGFDPLNFGGVFNPAGFSGYGSPVAGEFTQVGGSSFLNQSPEEIALRQAQIGLINQQRDIATEMLRRQNLLEPLLLQQQGYEQVLDAQGNVTGYRKIATPGQEQTDEINNLLRTRTLAALKGELPVDPALERSLTENRLTLGESLRRQLGTGYETSTPGIEALADYDKRAEELRSASRFDQLRVGEGVRLASEDMANRLQQQRFGNVVGLNQLGQAPAGIYSQALTGYQPISGDLLKSRALLADYFARQSAISGGLEQARIAAEASKYGANKSASAAESAGWGSAIGTLGSAFVGSDAGQELIGDFGSWLFG